MSTRDYKENHELLPPLEGRRCSLTLAANTIKLHIDENRKGGDYIWIDPPWALLRDGATIATSASYPDPEDEDYQRRHVEWGSQFDDVFESHIHQISATAEGALRIELDDGYAFDAPADPFESEEEDDWYDHWYVWLNSTNREQTDALNELPSGARE